MLKSALTSKSISKKSLKVVPVLYAHARCIFLALGSPVCNAHQMQNALFLVGSASPVVSNGVKRGIGSMLWAPVALIIESSLLNINAKQIAVCKPLFMVSAVFSSHTFMVHIQAA